MGENEVKRESKFVKFLKAGWPYITITIILLGLLVAVFVNRSMKDEKEQEKVESSKAQVDQELGYRPEDYITLGKYKGLEYNKSAAGVSDEDLQDAIDQELTDYKKVNRAAKNGDLVVINYTAYINGKKVSELSTKGYEMIVGDNELDESLDEAVLGKKAGYSFELKIDDPTYFLMEDSDTDYSDKTANFEIKITEVDEAYLLDLTDEWVKENYEEDEGLTTVDEYKQYMYDYLYQESQDDIEASEATDLWNMVLANSTMNGYPDELYQMIVDMDYADASYQADQWGLTVEEYCQTFDINLDELYETDTKSELVMWAIAKEEGISVTDGEIEEQFNSLYQDYGFDSADEMKEVYDSYDIERAILEEKVQTLVEDNANITEIPSAKSSDSDDE